MADNKKSPESHNECSSLECPGMQNNEEEASTDVFIINQMGLTVLPEITRDTRKLVARRNKIEEIKLQPESQLESLDVSDNLIHSIANLDGCASIKMLDVGYNLITEIPKVSLPALEELYLMSNDISEMKNLDFPDLVKLDLAGNEIKKLENINCVKLREGYFGANEIDTIGDITHLESLVILDLQCNRLRSLDCALLPTSLRELLLNNNKGLNEIYNVDRLVNLKMIGIKNTKLRMDERIGLEIWK